MKTSATRAIFTRNFLNYFASPTGYVFICVFVLLSSIAAFCPYEFFNANLANLDQLNIYFPLIMLVFIPAITMSIWSDERRQGTDELLLTIPASDFDIVLGKYLAAVAIYTVSLLFSGASNLAVLSWLGDPDLGLLVATYVGYWMVGLAMLGIGMVASFTTSNLTVAYVLGSDLNAPLVVAVWADAILGPDLAKHVKAWSIGQQLSDFGHGVISLSGIAYFTLIALVTLYLSMVLIGQRHWRARHSTALSWTFHLAIHAATAAAVVAVWLLGLKGLLPASSALYVISLLYLAVNGLLLSAWNFVYPTGVGSTMPGHYLLRTVVLVIVVAGLNVFFQRHDLRADITSERLSSLSPSTRELLQKLDAKRPVQIEAFVSPEVPESYVQTRLNLLSLLRELDALGGDKLHVQVRDTEQFSEEATRAEQLYGISPRQVVMQRRGVWSVEDIFLHVAVSCGLQKIEPLFYDRGIPAEYELVRSIATVSQQKRERIGVVTTDAPLYGQFDFQSGSSSADWPIIDELQKQYDVEQLDLASPIPEDEHYDAILAVQPSSLGPEQMGNFVAAVKRGCPAAIFEDPMPCLAGGVPATSEPRRTGGGMAQMFARQPPPPKGDIADLWDTLGVIFDDQQVIWQEYNPYPKLQMFSEDKEFVFVDEGAPRDQGQVGGAQPAASRDVFNQDDPVSSRLQQVLFPFPGSIDPLPSFSTDFEFTPLVRTGNETGTIPFDRIMKPSLPFMPSEPDPRRYLLYARPTGEQYVLAAHIRGKGQPKGDPAAPQPPDLSPVHAVLVADIDMLTPAFFSIRAEGHRPDALVNYEFDNVTFILNVMDVLAGDERFLELRKRRRLHRTLTRIEEQTKAAKQEADDERQKFMEEFEDRKQREQEAFDKKIEDLQNRRDVDPQQLLIEVAMAQNVGQRRLNAAIEQLERERDTAVGRIETDLRREIDAVQNSYKLRAALFPLILPMVLAAVVFVHRRIQEQEGVAQTRLR